MIAFVIEYHSRSTVNDRPVGRVYAQQDDIAPRIWTYTYDPTKATVFGSWEDAERERLSKSWPESRTVPLEDAPVLERPA